MFIPYYVGRFVGLSVWRFYRHVPVALFTMLVGLFLTISRKKAISQVLGYLVLENGIFVFGLLLVEAMPVLVELGVLLDLFVCIFVMGIILNHISREFRQVEQGRKDRPRATAGPAGHPG